MSQVFAAFCLWPPQLLPRNAKIHNTRRPLSPGETLLDSTDYIFFIFRTGSSPSPIMVRLGSSHICPSRQRLFASDIPQLFNSRRKHRCPDGRTVNSVLVRADCADSSHDIRHNMAGHNAWVNVRHCGSPAMRRIGEKCRNHALIAQIVLMRVLSTIENRSPKMTSSDDRKAPAVYLTPSYLLQHC